MTQIDGLGGKVNWDNLLNALQGTDGTQAASKLKAAPNLQLNATSEAPIAKPSVYDKWMVFQLNATSETPPANPAPNAPTLDKPVPPTSEGNAPNLQGLLDKLSKDKGFKFNNQELSTLNDALRNLLGSVNAKVALNASQNTNASNAPQNTNASNAPQNTNASNAPQNTNATNASPKTSSSQTLFDLYALMCLLAECAQEQKNAQRDLRQAETNALVTSIQNQADAQKSAAWTGLIAGSIICGLQAVAAGITAYKTISNVRAESALGAEMGVKQAATEVAQAQSQLKTDMDALAEFDAAHPAPAEGNLPEDVQQQRAELQQKVEDSKAKLMQKNQAFKLKQTVMSQSDDFVKIKISEARIRGASDVNMALGNLGQAIVRGAVDIQQAEAMAKAADQKKAEEELSQTRDLMDSFQEVMDQVLKLAQAILQAENESMRSAIQA